jgi:hypothetical protein
MVLLVPWTIVTAVSAPIVNVPGLVVPPVLEVVPQPAIKATRHTHKTQRRETFA